MTRKMRTTIEILTPHAQHYDYFLQNFWAYCSRHGRVCGKVHFYGGHFFTWLYRAGYGGPFWREQPWSIVNFHFCRMDEAVIALSWCYLSMGLSSIRQKWKFRSLDRGFGDFRGCTKRPWFMEPAGSHTSAPLELWAYLKCFHVLVMKIKLSPHKFRASMPF